MMLVTLSLLSHGLVASGANFLDMPRDLRLPDLGRYQKSMAFRVVLMSSSYIIFICLVPNTGTRLVILDVLVAMLGGEIVAPH